MKTIGFISVLRDIKSNFSRFISIFAIVAIGVGFFAGLRAAKPDMIDSANQYYNNQLLMDFSIISVDGFTEEDINIIKEQVDADPVKAYAYDCLTKVDKTEGVIKFYSYSNKINTPEVNQGRLPTSLNECVVDANSVSMPIKIGDVIKIQGDNFNCDEFKVVGLVDTAMYISGTQYGTTSIGNGQVGTVAFLNEDAFKGDPNTLFIKCDFLRKYDCYSKEYKNAVDSVIKRLDGILDNRLKSILDGSYDYRKLDLNKYDSDLAQSVTAVYDAKEKLDNEYNELIKNKDYLDKTKDLIDSKSIGLQHTLEQTESFIEQEVAKYDQLMNVVLKLQGEVSKAEEDLAAAKSSYESKIKLVDEKRALLAAMTDAESEEYKTLQQEIDTLQAEADAINKDLPAKEKLVTDKKAALEKATKEYDSAYASADESFKEINGANNLTAEELVQMTISYRSALAEYNARIAIYDQSRAQLSESLNQVVEAVGKIYSNFDNLWYFSDRSDLPGHSEFGENAERIGNISKVFPAFFLLVAMLVCLTNMTRLVGEHRTKIGVLKALGYSNLSITARYVAYAMIATLLGCGVGVSIGFILFPKVILFTYSMLYTINCQVTPFRFDIALASSFIMSVCIFLTVIAACSKEFNNTPGSLMRPKAPKPVKRVFLDKIKFIWNKLSFTQKVIARNMFLHKKRKMMTLVGIAGCAALMITGFGLRDSVTDIINKQFDQIWNFDGTAYYENYEKADSAMSANGVDDWLMCYQKTHKAEYKKASEEVNVIVPENNKQLSKYIKLRERTSGKAYSLNDGCLITEKLSKLLSVDKGDKIKLDINGKKYSFKVRGVVENYAGHYVYIPNEVYSNVVGKSAEYNTALIKYDGNETKLAEKLIKSKAVLGVKFNSEVKSTFSDIVKILSVIIVVMILSAAALSFVVVYNLTDINIAERTREIATLKVLGFTKKEMYRYVFRENTVISLIGTAIGIGLGYILAMYVINTAEIDMVMFGREIYPLSYVASSVLSVVFVVVVNILMRPKINKIDLVESLKAVE